MWTKKIVIIVLLAVSSVSAESMDNSIKEIETKIDYVRKELRKLQKERQSLRDDYKTDAVEFQTYRKMVLQKKRELVTEIDTVKLVVKKESERKDELSTKFNSLKNREANIIASNKQLSRELVGNINSVLTIQNSLPPLTKESILSSLEILKKELESGGIDNIEAMNRYFTILETIDNIPSTVQVTQGNSNLPFIRGMVYRVRLGSVYEAVVNIDGTKAGLWRGYDENGTPIFEELTDELQAAEILHSVHIREGKSIPAIGSFPFHGYSIHKENK